MSLKDITITGSIGSIATQSYGQKTYISSTDDQSFPLEHITGSYAGSWPNFPLRGLNTSNSASNTTVNLVVNVTQSWPGSNTTPLGIVPYVHNTMEEFIDGEFSGSSYVVTDGSLTDAQCEQFLTVNTTPVNYSIFPFYKNAYQDPANVYLNRNTVPLNGQIYIYYYNYNADYTYGIYAKIARIDALGHDNTLSLQELRQFSYVDSNAGKMIFNVVNINEYPDYYFYEVKTNTTPNVTLNDDNILDHSLNATYLSNNIPASPSFNSPFSSSNGTWTKTIDSQNYFNDYNTGTYIFGDTPNIQLQYTASLTFTQASSGYVKLVILNRFSNNLSALTVKSNTVNFPLGTNTLIISNSGFFQNVKTNKTIILYGSDNNLTNVTASFIINQAASAQQSTSSFVISPYLLSTFTNSDCDVLMNNADLNDVSTFYREVLYENGGTTPSNLQQIISGTAEYAQINDYLYNANANVLPRYQGVRTTSNGFNLPSTDGFTNEELANFDPKLYPNNLVIDNNKGTPSVEQTTTYFGYFDSLKANWPIFLNSTSPVLKYLIKEDGTVFSPSSDEATYWNIVDSFERGKKAYTSLLNDTTIIFSNTSSILLSGQSYTPILYNISASTKDTAFFNTTIDFINIQGGVFSGTPLNYNFRAQGYADVSSILNVGTTVNIFENTANITILYDPANGFVNTTAINHSKPQYAFGGVPQTTADIRVIGRVYFNSGISTSVRSLVTLTLYKEDTYGISTQIGSSQVYLDASQNPDYTWDGTDYVTTSNTLATPVINLYNFIPLPGDKLYATITNNGPYPVGLGNTSNNYRNDFKMACNNYTAPTVTSGIFWVTGSNNGNSITSSIFLGGFLGGNYKQQDIENSGFDPIELPCDIQVGDEIRFEYNEDYTYRVIEIIPSGSGGYPQYCYTLDRTIPSSPALDINHFTVRRLKKDSITGIALDKTLIIPINSGFLFPEYPSSAIKKNLPNIINDLYNRTLI